MRYRTGNRSREGGDSEIEEGLCIGCKSTKVWVFRIMVMSTLLFGVDTSPVKQKEVHELITFQVWCFQDILGEATMRDQQYLHHSMGKFCGQPKFEVLINKSTVRTSMVLSCSFSISKVFGQ